MLIVGVCIALFLIAYVTYGSYIVKQLDLDDNRKTPAHTEQDGVDYVPTKSPVLLGHHFASIAGASPIVGPITAAVFGWIPALIWIVLGNIFIGAVHDITALVASVRHKGKSIGMIIQDSIGVSGKKLFNLFAWLTLVLIVAAFLIITANTFVAEPAAGTASLLFIIVAVLYGFFVYRRNVPTLPATIIGIVALFACIAVGLAFPISLSQSTWVLLMMVYIVIASIAPVWILLQPRDYLNSFLLYSLMIGAVVGLVLTNPTIQFSGFSGFKTDLGYLFPVLFVTIACGAVSGFHSLVASGTTSKQLNKESDAKLLGYGAMLIEGLLAVIALITAAMLIPADYSNLMKNGGPVALFSAGVGQFMTTLGIPLAIGKSFSALVVSAFALTTLDTATRLGRFIFAEYFDQEAKETGKAAPSVLTNKWVGTVATAGAGGLLALSGQWAAIWPIFGSANQLLGAIALLAVSVWLAKMGKSNWYTKYPMYFMFAVTFTALVTLVWGNLTKGNYLISIFGVALLILSVLLGSLANKSLKNIAVGRNSGKSQKTTA
nr:carbon starvation protein A [Ammoniphilus resinae]